MPDGVTKTFWRNWRFWLIAAISAGLAWRLTDYFLRFPVWDDEASLGLNIMHHSYTGLLHPLQYNQVCPIGFLWISKFIIQYCGTGVWALRGLPLLAGIAAVLSAWPIFKSFGGRRVGLLATALIACSLATNRFGTDFKPYSLDLLLALCIVGLTLRAIRRPGDYRPVVGIALLTPIAIAFSYPSMFVLGAALVAQAPALWQRRRQASRAIYIGWAMILAGSVAAVYFGVIRGQMNHTNSFMQKFWQSAFPPHGLAIVGWLIHAHVSNMMSYPFGGSQGIALAIAPLVALGLLRLWRKRRWAELTLLAGPFVLTFLAAYLHKYPYGADARVEQHLVPSIALLAALGAVTLCAALIRKSRNINIWRNAANIPVAVMVLFALFMIGKDIRFPWRTPAPLVAQRFITRVFAHAGPHTHIVLLNQHPFRYSVLLSWQLVTQRHPVIIGPDLRMLPRLAAVGSYWLVQFHFSSAEPIAAQTLQQFRHALRHGIISADITRRLVEPFSGFRPVYMQEVHITSAPNPQ